jgi:hypothetical protein
MGITRYAANSVLHLKHNGTGKIFQITVLGWDYIYLKCYELHGAKNGRNNEKGKGSLSVFSFP